jgi:GTP-binding protein
VKFVDHVRVHAKAGDGGNGCCSFRREKYIPKGGPDGGNGGHGGNIILRAGHDTASLVNLFYQPLVRARNGAHGQGKNKVGKCAPDLIVEVPVGTLVYALPEEFHPKAPDPEDFGDDTAKSEKPELDPRNWEPIADLLHPGDEFILCAGGRGGRGNASFKSSINRAPRQHTSGDPGEEGWFLLELRTIAFAGLVGYPNAGKSTLLTKISSAHPKIASYPFTTLNPSVGVVDLRDYRRLTVADIPGIIEGAHENKGLGHEFLRHILRCRHLLFVIDAAGSEGRDPVEDLRNLRRELDLYDPALSAKPWTILANKTDLPAATDNLPRIQLAFPKQKLLPISSAGETGLEELKNHLDWLSIEAGGDPLLPHNQPVESSNSQ